MVKRVVVGAHYGLRDWLAQRVTAVVMVVYTVVFLGALLYLFALTLTDVLYAFADPRIRLS